MGNAAGTRPTSGIPQSHRLHNWVAEVFTNPPGAVSEPDRGSPGHSRWNADVDSERRGSASYQDLSQGFVLGLFFLRVEEDNKHLVDAGDKHTAELSNRKCCWFHTSVSKWEWMREALVCKPGWSVLLSFSTLTNLINTAQRVDLKAVCFVKKKTLIICFLPQIQSCINHTLNPSWYKAIKRKVLLNSRTDLTSHRKSCKVAKYRRPRATMNSLKVFSVKSLFFYGFMLQNPIKNGKHHMLYIITGHRKTLVLTVRCNSSLTCYTHKPQRI